MEIFLTITVLWLIFSVIRTLFQRRKVFVYITNTGEQRMVTATCYHVQRQALVFRNRYSVVCRAARGQWISVEMVG